MTASPLPAPPPKRPTEIAPQPVVVSPPLPPPLSESDLQGRLQAVADERDQYRDLLAALSTEWWFGEKSTETIGRLLREAAGVSVTKVKVVAPLTTPVVDHGVRWLPKTRIAALSRGGDDLVQRISDVVQAYIADAGSLTVTPALDQVTRHVMPGRLQVTHDDLTVVLGGEEKERIVLAWRWSTPTQEDRDLSRERASASTRGIPQAHGGKGGNRGPRSMGELVQWLKRDGFTVEMGGKHYGIYDSEGNRVQTMPVNPSDYRALANLTCTLRRDLGLSLRVLG